jgi:single-stranded DNA-binding protein
MTIDCAFFGFLAADADARTAKSGKPWTRLRVGVGRDDDVQWVNVAVFGKAAEIAATLKKGDRVYCEGAIKLDTWRGDDERHSLAVTAFKCERTHNIGRQRERKQDGSAPKTDDAFNDEIPF